MKNSGSIFISYRRDDSKTHTGRIYDRLVSHFGQDQVFKDVDSIPYGVDFAEYIDQTISRCQVALVIIGETWLSTTAEDGSRRLDSPTDLVRNEIESALRCDIPVIPVLLQGVSMPRDSELPESMQELARRNGTEVGDDPRFHADMDRLIEGIESLGIESLLSEIEIASESIAKENLSEKSPPYLSTQSPSSSSSRTKSSSPAAGSRRMEAPGTEVKPGAEIPSPKQAAPTFEFDFVASRLGKVELSGSGKLQRKTQSPKAKAEYHRKHLGSAVSLDLGVISGGRL